jgi:hypothetical protein
MSWWNMAVVTHGQGGAKCLRDNRKRIPARPRPPLQWTTMSEPFRNTLGNRRSHDTGSSATAPEHPWVFRRVRQGALGYRDRNYIISAATKMRGWKVHDVRSGGTAQGEALTNDIPATSVLRDSRPLNGYPGHFQRLRSGQSSVGIRARAKLNGVVSEGSSR